MKYQIEKNQLTAIINDWMKIAQVFAPIKVENFTKFARIENPKEFAFKGPHNTLLPPKSLMLPQSEVLFKYQNGDFLPPNLGEETRIILGIRPCDARAISLLDSVFDKKPYVDPYWKSRRDHTILIGIGCSNPCSTCFCTSTGSGPFDKSGLDVLITELKDVYAIEVISTKAKKLFLDQVPLEKDNVGNLNTIQKDAVNKIPAVFETDGIRDKLYGMFESNYWQKISESCLGCGVCTFLCPTCFCFDIVDEAQRGERVRNWDTCMFRVYSQEASGHNPRPTRGERTRQRLMHKFAYWLEQIDQFGCVGCGRCVQNCPVGLDIREMVRQAQAWEKI